MADAWRSYDSAAATHGRLAARSIFEQPATDLVTRIGLPASGRILDAGTGTGIAGFVALKLAASGIVVVGVDPSVGMLQVARGEPGLRLAAGALPNLPFPDATFERVLANFVISHVDSYQTALLEMVRVLRPGGKLGVSTWGALENEFRQYWQTLAERFQRRSWRRRRRGASMGRLVSGHRAFAPGVPRGRSYGYRSPSRTVHHPHAHR